MNKLCQCCCKRYCCKEVDTKEECNRFKSWRETKNYGEIKQKEILYSNLMANAILQSNVTSEQIKSKLQSTTNEEEKQFLKFALNKAKENK